MQDKGIGPAVKVIRGVAPRRCRSVRSPLAKWKAQR